LYHIGGGGAPPRGGGGGGGGGAGGGGGGRPPPPLGRKARLAPGALPISVRGGCQVVPPLRLGFAEPPLPPPVGEERSLAGRR
ncbi:hypothetical protein AB0V92_24575, partial [Mesorhizobium ciceri]